MWNAFRNKIADHDRTIIISTGQKGAHPAYFPASVGGVFDIKASLLAHFGRDEPGWVSGLRARVLLPSETHFAMRSQCFAADCLPFVPRRPVAKC
jgi:hypothetical protein